MRDFALKLNSHSSRVVSGIDRYTRTEMKCKKMEAERVKDGRGGGLCFLCLFGGG